VEDEVGITAAATPRRAPGRRHRRTATRPPHIARHPARERENAPGETAAVTESGGSGSSGRGTFDDDDDGKRRRRDGGDGDRRPLLMALAILAIGAGVMSARLLSRSAGRRG
jgi:hypothetical protein